MRRLEADFRIQHTSLEDPLGDPIATARVSDRGRLGLVIQGAALLSHLEACECRRRVIWSQAHVDEGGCLRGVRFDPRRDLGRGPDSLVELVDVVFGSRERIVGKGLAKRIANQTLQTWRRALGSLSTHRILVGLLDAADFFWQPGFSMPRQSLAARWIDSGSVQVRVAGSGSFEREMLRLSQRFEDLGRLLQGQVAAELWARVRRSRGARTSDGAAPLLLAAALHRSGRYSEALEVLEGLSEVAAQVLAIDCLRNLGRLRLATRSFDRLAARSDLNRNERTQLVEVGVSLALVAGNRSRAESRVERLMPRAGAGAATQSALLFGEIGVAFGDVAGAERALRAIGESAEGLEWHWRQLRLEARAASCRGLLRDAERAAGCSLLAGRRRMTRLEAAELWQLIARVRLDQGLLGRGGIAAGHALRLAEGVEGQWASAPARLLLEARLRQGRAEGVVCDDPSLAVRGPVDSYLPSPSMVELVARYELLRGQPLCSWRMLQPALRTQASFAMGGRERLLSLAARALGWLGRGADAREQLESLAGHRPSGLEPEELPPLWALAGDWQRAREAVDRSPVGRLWRRVLEGGKLTEKDWPALRQIGAVRASRMIFDLQLLLPGSLPTRWLDWAAARLRELGAGPFAERLDLRRKGSWAALRAYLEAGSGRSQELESLFHAAGYFDVRLEWHDSSASSILVAGRGGASELRTEVHHGELVLSTDVVDAVLETLFALAAREVRPGPDVETEAKGERGGILGRSRGLRAAMARLERLAATDVSVLIRGETGTGKELAARRLHSLSARSKQPFVAVNCAAFSESLLLSDLFGHIRGAFTGADRSRAGIFEAAAGGTVLLDEIGDLPVAAQGKLLRVLQEGEVRRVGESLPRKIDVRVVAATHRDLEAMVADRAFRRDLLYRLRVGRIELPPLRQREDDVLILSEHFLRGSGRRLSRNARNSLLRHAWPGNVRELQNVLEVAVALSAGRLIDESALDLPRKSTRPMLGYHQQVEEYRKKLVRDALAASQGSRAEAARKLGLSRQALSYLVQRFSIDVGSCAGSTRRSSSTGR